jgi:hypothetical protein
MVFHYVTPCSIVNVSRCLLETCYFSVLFPEDRGSSMIRNFCKYLPDWTASYPTRQYYLQLESVYYLLILEYSDSTSGVIRYGHTKYRPHTSNQNKREILRNKNKVFLFVRKSELYMFMSNVRVYVFCLKI